MIKSLQFFKWASIIIKFGSMSYTLHTVEFSAICYTRFGQNVYLVGNIPELGSWMPSQGLRLYTDDNFYPRWESFRSIPVMENDQIEFKLCIIHQNGQVRWEIAPNRIYNVKESCNIQITESDPSMIITSKNVCHTICNKKKLYEILKDLSSDSSSSIQFRNEYLIENEFNMRMREDYDDFDASYMTNSKKINMKKDNLEQIVLSQKRISCQDS